MMKLKSVKAVGALALAMATGACGSTGLGDILGGLGGGGQQQPQNGQFVAEVTANDVQQQLLQVRTEQGETGVVRWDRGTEVHYRNEVYPASALERGDIIELRVQQTTDGALYTDYVVVRQSVQERSGY